MTELLSMSGLTPVQLATVGLLCLAAGVLFVWFDPPRHGMAALRKLVRLLFPSVKQLSPADLSAWLADASRPAPVLLDVRTEAEFAVSRLPGAVRVNENCTRAELEALTYENRPLVLYCVAGYRASVLAKKLEGTGLTNVANLEGGVFDWVNGGRLLESSGKPTLQVHPYSRVWSHLLKPGSRGDLRQR